MNELAIIADDLTGATDSGVQFARRGFDTQVVLHAEEVSAIERNSEIIVLDTDSRAVAAGEAYERTRLAALQVARMGFKHVYKKLDSTLRGNLGAEIDAVADAIPVDCIIVAPAYPKIGRTTRNGIHYVNDVRIDRTETAKDPKSPVAEADLVKLLASQSQRQAGLLPLEALRAGAEAASLRIGELLRSGIEIIVCDAVSDEDLRRIADVAVSNRIASLLGLAASECMDTTELQGVILTGGDTTKAVCRQLNASGIRLVREIEPGIPLGRLVGSIPLNVVTKAGAFGQENSLVHAKAVLKGELVDE